MTNSQDNSISANSCVSRDAYRDPAIATQAAAESHVRDSQADFHGAREGYQGHLDRGSDALAAIIANLYVSIETILISTTAEVQAQILLSHHVRPAKRGASEFGPWIKILTGWERPGGEMKKAVNGAIYPEWDWNRSFEKYFHVMEVLRANKVLSGHADYIKHAGGAVAIVEASQKRLSKAAVSGKKATENEQREMLLSECTAVPFELPFDLPADAGEFFTVLCRRTSDSKPVMLAIAHADAERELAAVAKVQFEALAGAKKKREAEEARQLLSAEAARYATERAERDFMKLMLNPERLAKMQAEAKRRYDAGELSADNVA